MQTAKLTGNGRVSLRYTGVCFLVHATRRQVSELERDGEASCSGNSWASRCRARGTHALFDKVYSGK